MHSICQALGIIWDEAEDLQRLADLSHPKVPLDTAGLTPDATLLANLLARNDEKRRLPTRGRGAGSRRLKE